MAARLILILFTISFLRADALDDAGAEWAKKILTHFMPDQVAYIVWAPPVSSDAASLAWEARAKTALARALQRRARNPRTMEVKATWSENAKEYLLVAEIKADPDTIVEIEAIPKVTAPSLDANVFSVGKRLLWQQGTRIFDIAVTGDQMLVLDAAGLSRYAQQDGAWKQQESVVLDEPVIRDGRGRLRIAGDIASAEVSGLVCRGPWRPMIQMECMPGGRFAAGRNTLEEEGWPPHIARAAWAGRTVVADADGPTRLYDASRVANGAVEGIGDAFVTVDRCPGGMILASGAENRTGDTLALYALEELKPVRTSDAVDVPGPVTELWPTPEGAFAVVHNLGAQRYEAYSISVDCSR